MDKEYYKQYEPIFGSWYIKELLGEGSFGKVYEIERKDFGTTYKAALKVITIPQSQSEIKSIMAEGMDKFSITSYYNNFVEEIASEVELMSKMKGNSHVVSYEDHQARKHKDGIGWDILIRMELLTPLFDYAKNNTMTRKDVIQLGIDICKALELCQKYNIIHRDIKPENIFVSDNGDYKLGDFGIARTLEQTTGMLSKKGTQAYMAPEIYRGESYGSNVDIYSLGIVMYRMLNDNRMPFMPAYPAPITHNDRETAIQKRISGAKLPVPSHADGRLAEIVLKACSFKPKDRYFSPQELREDLEAILYSTEEGEIIYPAGDAIPIPPNRYISKVEQWEETPPDDVDDVPVLHEDGGTVSDWDEDPPLTGRTDSDFGGTSNEPDRKTSDKKSTTKTVNRKKTLIICAAALVICLVAAIILYFNFSEKQKTINAFNFLNNGQYSDAIAEFDELIAKDGKNIGAYAGKAMAQISSGEDDGAADTISTMITTCDAESATKKDTYFDTVSLPNDGTDETLAGISAEGTDETPEPTPSKTPKNGGDSTTVTGSPPTPTQTPNVGSGDPFGRVLQFLFQWICRYNILNDQADQNEILMEMIEENGLNALYGMYSRMDAPTANYPSGTYNEPIAVALSSSSEGTICYIMGEGEFRIKDSLIYEEPISVEKNNSVTHIMAVVYDSLYIPSEKLELTYELNRSALDQATYSHEPGNYSSSFGLTLSNPNEDGKIYYTTDGSEPTVESKEYSGKISVGEGTTNLKVKIIDSENDVSSGTLSLNYTVKLPESAPTPEPKRNGPTCPACGSTNTAFDPAIDAYKCYDCGRADTPEEAGAVQCPNCGSYDTSEFRVSAHGSGDGYFCRNCYYEFRP